MVALGADLCLAFPLPDSAMTYGSDLVESADAYTINRRITDADRVSAVLSVARNARDRADFDHLLDVLGLTDTANEMTKEMP